MPDRQRPPVRDAPHRHRDDTIVRLLALALAALAITTIPRTWLADLLSVAAWATLLASLLLTGLLFRRQARGPEQHGPRDRAGPRTRADHRPDEQRDNEQPLEDNSFDFNA
ncbi:MAG: hypothetical protein ACRDLA_07360 [Thermoleophilaceae bacterium]